MRGSIFLLITHFISMISPTLGFKDLTVSIQSWHHADMMKENKKQTKINPKAADAAKSENPQR